MSRPQLQERQSSREPPTTFRRYELRMTTTMMTAAAPCSTPGLSCAHSPSHLQDPCQHPGAESPNPRNTSAGGQAFPQRKPDLGSAYKGGHKFKSTPSSGDSMDPIPALSLHFSRGPGFSGVGLTDTPETQQMPSSCRAPGTPFSRWVGRSFPGGKWKPCSVTHL